VGWVLPCCAQPPPRPRWAEFSEAEVSAVVVTVSVSVAVLWG